MKLNYRELLPEEFDAESRVWIYQSSRPFSLPETIWVEENIKKFTESWHSHGVKVKGYGNLFFEQFVILMADETASGVSGCSTDSSVHFMKEIEKNFNIRLFDRQILGFFINDHVRLVPLSQLTMDVSKGLIHKESLYFNNTVSTKKELENDWIIPLKDSWLFSRVKFPEGVTK